VVKALSSRPTCSIRGPWGVQSSRMGQIACTAWGILTMRAYVVKALARRWNRDPFWFIARDAAGKRQGLVTLGTGRGPAPRG